MGDYNRTPDLGEQIAGIARQASRVDVRPRVSLEIPSPVAIAHNSFVQLAWTEVVDDRFGMFEPPDDSIVTVPKAGLYAVCLTVSWAANATGYRRVSINLHGETRANAVPAISGATTDQTMTLLGRLGAGNVVAAFVIQTSGADLNVANCFLDVICLGT